MDSTAVVLALIGTLSLVVQGYVAIKLAEVNRRLTPSEQAAVDVVRSEDGER